MAEVTLIIDGKQKRVLESTHLLEAVQAMDIDIPALCFLESFPPFNSCMLCLVEDLKTGFLVPACSTRAKDGDIISTGSERVRRARKAALELLISEHDGDCEAPCRRGCPLYMDIPRMLRAFVQGDIPAAADTIYRHIPLPGTLSRVCPGTCEKVCRRGKIDTSIGIRGLIGFAAETNPNPVALLSARRSKGSGRRAAVIGAGPAGLSAGFYLVGQGHGCVIFDKNKESGGNLRNAVEEKKLPRRALDRDIEVIKGLGVEFRMETRIEPADMARLARTFDAVVLAVGGNSPLGKTACDFPGRVWVCGTPGGDSESRNAVRSSALGRAAALEASRCLDDPDPPASTGGRRFDSVMHRLNEEELNRYLDAKVGQHAGDAPAGIIDLSSAKRESLRCLHCDCGDKYGCSLRNYTDRYGAAAGGFSGIEHRAYESHKTGSGFSYEPGKCIRCGNCIRVAERAGEPLGLSFWKKSYDLQVRIPFGESLEKALALSGVLCVEVCPTGALLGRRRYEDNI